MRKTLSLSSAVVVPALFAAALLAGCGKHEDNAPAPSAENTDAADTAAQAKADAAARARDEAASTAQCAGNPLIKAMPPKTTIDGLPFRTWECTFNTIHAVYGKDDGKQVDISLTDTRSPDIDKQPVMKDFYRRTADTQLAITQSSVQMLVATIDSFKANPALTNAIGGPEYASMAEPSATKDPIVIHVGSKEDDAPAEVIALFKDRHVLTMRANDNGSAVTGLTAAQAQALYDPFIQQLHPELLP
ncbi:hypothetical protein [Dyella telluris]|uniref:DUF3558 domain-containing protein n=1 Tax=Dyella telluris TaxID=2763498 RepID=A0A7G8Q1F9_9GAMM|nr:hypothetical protein [Dyella telluris]QNK00617.1 hypothetical protein H8F01_16160 [Dyella telluris]